VQLFILSTAKCQDRGQAPAKGSALLLLYTSDVNMVHWQNDDWQVQNDLLIKDPDHVPLCHHKMWNIVRGVNPCPCGEKPVPIPCYTTVKNKKHNCIMRKMKTL
jgi:hypothetical protein